MLYIRLTSISNTYTNIKLNFVTFAAKLSCHRREKYFYEDLIFIKSTLPIIHFLFNLDSLRYICKFCKAQMNQMSIVFQPLHLDVLCHFDQHILSHKKQPHPVERLPVS